MSQEYLGVGWRYPVQIEDGEIALSRYAEDVREAIWIILSTAPGERVMRPDFGCGIHEYVFAPNNATTRGQIAYQVRAALAKWEPRIDILDVRVESSSDEENLLLVRVDYRVRSNNTFHNLVYPFYIQEGLAGA